MAAPDRQKTRLCSVKLSQVVTLPKAVRSDANDYSARLILYTVSITVELSQNVGAIPQEARALSYTAGGGMRQTNGLQ